MKHSVKPYDNNRNGKMHLYISQTFNVSKGLCNRFKKCTNCRSIYITSEEPSTDTKAAQEIPATLKDSIEESNFHSELDN